MTSAFYCLLQVRRDKFLLSLYNYYNECITI